MCGIFGYIGQKTNAADLVLTGLKALEYRGYDSWGIAAVPAAVIPAPEPGSREKKTGFRVKPGMTDKIVVKKKTGKIGDANVADMPASSFAFGHTRWATHGGVTDVNAHPHLDCSGNIAIIHNGILENYEEIKKTLAKKGHRFVSQTDSEVIAHLIEEYALAKRDPASLNKPGVFSKAVQRAFNDMEGLNAFIVMNTAVRQFVAVRNGSPLVVGFGDGENFLASDAAAMLPHTRQVHFLEDDEMALMTGRGVMIFNARTGERVRPKKQKLTWSVAAVEKGKYPYFMLKEIHEQPGVVADIAADNADHAKKLAATIREAAGTYMIGCGTASYACLAGTYIFSKVARWHVNWAIGSEFGYHLDFLTPKSLVIALSQSGETIDLLEAVRKAKKQGAKLAALTNVLGSSLYREADYSLIIGAGPEKGVASTKAFTGKLAHLILLAYAMSGSIKEGQAVLTAAVAACKQVLKEINLVKIRALAKKLKASRHIYVIGRGLSYPAALEIALKIKEISYIHAEGLAAGELKHGPLALVEKGTACIALLPNDETYGANLAGAMEMKARGGFVIGISHKNHEVFDVWLPVTDVGVATIIPNVIVGQLLAYYLTLERGFDPDMPRNLAKSVTVK